jgi:hypothetical protein
VAVGINEFRRGIACLNELGARHKPKAEEKSPKLLDGIRKIMEPSSQTEPRLRTTLLYTNMTAQSVYDALVSEGWSPELLPTVRTISNFLHGRRFRRGAWARLTSGPVRGSPEGAPLEVRYELPLLKNQEPVHLPVNPDHGPFIDRRRHAGEREVEPDELLHLVQPHVELGPPPVTDKDRLVEPGQHGVA